MAVPTDKNPERDVLFESEQVLVLNKPVGLATQAPSGIDCLEFRVRRYLARTHGKSGQVYVGVPHRLDRPVSGVIVMAKSVLQKLQAERRKPPGF